MNTRQLTNEELQAQLTIAEESGSRLSAIHIRNVINGEESPDPWLTEWIEDRRTYPATVAECIDDNLRYRLGVIAAVKRFARSKPWRGSLPERLAKFNALHAHLCDLYEKRTTFSYLPADRSNGRYRPATDEILLEGKLSVVTYLHEFGHALGKGERGACRWSINLFKRCFPRSFARCDQSAHMLRSN